MRSAAGLLSLTVLLAAPLKAEAQCRPPLRVDQETYQRIEDKAYVYVEDINSAGATAWGPFSVRVLVGQYRSPFLLEKGRLGKDNVDKLLRSRGDVSQQTIAVPGYDPKKNSQKSFGPTVTLKSGTATLTLRVRDVQPVRGFRSIDYLFLEVCGPR